MKRRLSKRILTVFMILVLTFSLVACGKKKTVVGAWVETNNSVTDEYIFNEDRTGSYTLSTLSPINFVYTIEGDTIAISMTILGKEKTDTYNYKLVDDKLVMTIDGEEVTFERQKQK